MSNLVHIINICAALSIPISLWVIYVLIGRWYYTTREKWDDERMQARVNREIEKHSPISRRSPRIEKSRVEQKFKR